MKVSRDTVSMIDNNNLLDICIIFSVDVEKSYTTD